MKKSNKANKNNKKTKKKKIEKQVEHVLNDEQYQKLLEDVKKKVKKPKQVRSCELVSTIKALSDLYKCKEEKVVKEIIKRIEKNEKMFKHFALIVHDKDIDEATDELKEKHLHVVLELNYPSTFPQIAKKMGVAPNFIETIKQTKLYGDRVVSDVGGALSYLTHRNAPDKYQYDDKDVIASDGWDWKTIRAMSEEMKSNSELGGIYERIVSGELKEFDIPKELETSVYVKNKAKIDKAFEYKRLMDKNNHTRNTTVMYIDGKAGTGKTTIAKMFCENLGLSYFITGGGNDPFDGYSGEECLIMDDVRSDYFEAQEWLKILDQNTISMVRSRYHNKYVDAKYIILTSTKTLYEFVYQFRDEEPAQFFRRLSINIQVTREKMFINEYNAQARQYLQIKEMDNPVTKIYGLPSLGFDRKNEILNGFTFQKEDKEEQSTTDFTDDDLPF